MNWELANTIVACLARSGDPSPAIAGLSRFELQDWAGTLAWLDLSGLALYFRDRIKDSQVVPKLPSLLTDRLAKNYSDNCRRADDIAEEFFGLTRLLQNQGIPHAALKGFAKVPDYCADIRLRMQFDHDFLVAPASLELAGRSLLAAGFVRKNPGEAHPHVYVPAGMPAWPRQAFPDFYGAQLARPVELHVDLWEPEAEGIAFRLPDDFLSRATYRTWGCESFRALSEEDLLLFEALHAFRHVLRNWCRLSILFEIACFLGRRGHDAPFWLRFGARLKDLPRVSQAVGVVFDLAGRLFRCDLPDGARAVTIDTLTPIQRLWVERYGRRLAIQNFRTTKHALLLHREFVDDPSTWATLARCRLIPSPRRAFAVVGSAVRSILDWPHGFRRAVYALGRAWHHAAASWSYARESPRWRRLRAEALAGRVLSNGWRQTILSREPGGAKQGR